MTKQKFYRLLKDRFTGELKWEEAEGYRIRHNGEDFFIHDVWNHHWNDREWVISHGKTGTCIFGGSSTMEFAKQRFQWWLEETNWEDFEKAVQKQIEQYGLSPLYSEDKKKKTTKKKATTKKKTTAKKKTTTTKKKATTKKKTTTKKKETA